MRRLRAQRTARWLPRHLATRLLSLRPIALHHAQRHCLHAGHAPSPHPRHPASVPRASGSLRLAPDHTCCMEASGKRPLEDAENGGALVEVKRAKLDGGAVVPAQQRPAIKEVRRRGGCGRWRGRGWRGAASLMPRPGHPCAGPAENLRSASANHVADGPRVRGAVGGRASAGGGAARDAANPLCCRSSRCGSTPRATCWRPGRTTSPSTCGGRTATARTTWC